VALRRDFPALQVVDGLRSAAGWEQLDKVILGVNGIRLVGKRSGVGRCIEAVLRCLAEMDHPFTEFRVYTPAPIADEVVLPSCATNIVLPSLLPLAMWEQVTLLRAHGDKNLLFCPSYVIPLLAQCPTFLIHHGSYEGYPPAFNWWTRNKARAAYSLSAKRASVVCTVSEYSRRDMVRFYRIKPDAIHVVPDGVDTRLFCPITEPERLVQWRVKTSGLDTPFIVYVGKPVERRNLSSLIKAFGALKRDKRIPHRLLIVGADLPGTSPFRQVIATEQLANEVFVLGYVGHDEMPLVYNSADLLVYPSSYEGFGMPVLEAMACGTPVITLNNTSFPEFALGVAHLLENAEVATLERGIDTVLGDRIGRQRMSEKGVIRAAAYDWHLVTKRYLELMLPLVGA
jgi:glycosyltransferase involved in cell wall biosynthesis